MAVLVITENFGMKVNAGMNVMNWLIKVYVIKDLFGILVTVKCKCHKSCDVGKFSDYENCKCKKKKIVDKLFKEYIETVKK